jgi:hypothetical protein
VAQLSSYCLDSYSGGIDLRAAKSYRHADLDGGVIKTGKLFLLVQQNIPQPITLIGTYNRQGSRADAGRKQLDVGSI